MGHPPVKIGIVLFELIRSRLKLIDSLIDSGAHWGWTLEVRGCGGWWGGWSCWWGGGQAEREGSSILYQEGETYYQVLYPDIV